MSAILLAPHADDETLFASYVIQRDRPRVIVCLRSTAQEHRRGTTAAVRVRELAAAMGELGADWAQWSFTDHDPDWSGMEQAMRTLTASRVYAPAPAFEQNGHAPGQTPAGFGVLQHDVIGQMALDVFGAERVTGYTLYSRWGGRTRAVEVVPEPEWVIGKLRALACYRSQIEDPATRPHFLEPLREYLTP